MSDRAWEELLDVIDQKYGILSHKVDKHALSDAHELEETVTCVVFERSGTEYKFERVTRPRVADKKTHYHRSGGAQRIENIYDPTETTSKVLLFRKEGGTWLEIEPTGIL